MSDLGPSRSDDTIKIRCGRAYAEHELGSSMVFLSLVERAGSSATAIISTTDTDDLIACLTALREECES